jgi:phosphohistidine phosphatase SixA
MKKLILVRHAKSDWPENTDDFDRPLAEKGEKNAEKMAKFLKENNIEIDKFYSSPALRALKPVKFSTKNISWKWRLCRNSTTLPKPILNRSSPICRMN